MTGSRASAIAYWNLALLALTLNPPYSSFTHPITQPLFSYMMAIFSSPVFILKDSLIFFATYILILPSKTWVRSISFWAWKLHLHLMDWFSLNNDISSIFSAKKYVGSQACKVSDVICSRSLSILWGSIHSSIPLL